MVLSLIRLERMLVFAVLAVIVWLPLPLGSNRDWAIGLMAAFTGGITLAWVAVNLKSGKPVFGSSATRMVAMPMLALLLACQAWVACQWLFGLSQDNGATFQYLMLGLVYCVLFVMVTGLFQSRRRLTLLLAVLVISGTVQAFYGAWMTLSGTEWLAFTPKTAYIGDATGSYVNRNHFAGYLEMTLACGIGLLLALRDKRSFSWVNLLQVLMGPKALLRLALVIMVIALVMSHSRMGNMAFFASLLIVGGVFVMYERRNRLRNSLILCSLIIIDVLVISQYFGLAQLKDRLVNTRLHDVQVNNEVVQSANEVRADVFGYAIPLLLERPMAGHGAGTFEAVFQQCPGSNIRLHFDHAHNDYLQILIEFGLAGSLFLALFVVFALIQAFKALGNRQSIFRSGVGFAACMGIISLLIHSSTDFNLQIPANAATFVILSAIAVLANTHDHHKRRAHTDVSPAADA